jgi:quercetin dioxygenase-like cupin family protein
MIKYLQLPFHFDTTLLKQDVASLDATNWKLHYQKLHYEGDWSAIPLRSVDGNANTIIISPLNDSIYADTFFLDHCPYIKQLLSTFNCPLMAVRLLKLNAGAIIKEHRDAELCFEKGEVRIHIPVVTDEKVEFYLEGERVVMKEGECWYMNFNLPHNINNFSTTDRIHLVIDAKVNDWVKTLFTSDAIVVKKEIDDSEMIDAATKKQMIVYFREMGTPTANSMADTLEKEMAMQADEKNV